MKTRTRLSHSHFNYDRLEGRNLLASITVNSLADNTIVGDGFVTLREAIIAANQDGTTDLGEAGSGADRILFDLGNSGTFTISPNSQLPFVTEALEIDGTSQGNYADRPVVVLDGTNAGDANGLVITGGASIVRGIAVTNFQNYGLWVQTGGNNRFESNYIGIDPRTATAAPNGLDGVLIYQSAGNTIGGVDSGQGNVISGNARRGIWVLDTTATNNLIQNNRVGANPNATDSVANGLEGIYISGGANQNTVRDNVVSGNEGVGILIQDSGSENNRIEGNTIGVNANLTEAIPNSTGVWIGAGADTNFVLGNTISGNSNTGLVLFGENTSSNQVIDNDIGTKWFGVDAIPNGGNGVYIGAGARENNIRDNTISGNRNQGVVIYDDGTDSNVLAGNIVGMSASGVNRMPNLIGVLIGNGASNNIIGGTDADLSNVVSGNSFDGIRIAGSSTEGNQLKGNNIGVDVDGDPAPNQRNGVFLYDGTFNNTIGGTEFNAGNTIAFNRSGGVKMDALAFEEHALPGSGNAVLGNSIYLNITQGIDIGDHGTETNDAFDADSGVNGLQNYPVLSKATYDGANLVVNGRLDTAPNQNYRIEFFVNDVSAGVGDGQRLIAAANGQSSSSGYLPFGFNLPRDAEYGGSVTATATDESGNTSEFSYPITIENASGLPLISVMDRAISEADGSNTTIQFEVRLSKPAVAPVSIPYSLVNGSASINDDFVSTSSTLVFAVDEQSKFIDVTVVAAQIDEGDEYFQVKLGNASGGIVVDGEGTGTIFDNDSNGERPFGAQWYDLAKYMLGKVYVPVFVFDSDGTIDRELERWSPTEEQEIIDSVNGDLDWWKQTLDNVSGKHELEFVPDFTFVRSPIAIPYEPYARPVIGDTVELMVDSFLDFVSANDPAEEWYTDLRRFLDGRRLEKEADWAFPIFYNLRANDYDQDYADEQGFFNFAAAELYQFNGSMTGPGVVAHETAHIFYALDEYEGQNGGSYIDRSGYYDTQNLNAFNDHPNSDERVPSVLSTGDEFWPAYNQNTSSPSSLAMMGWQDSDFDGIFDVLDLPLNLDGTGSYDAETEVFSFTGNASPQVLENLNMAWNEPFRNDISTNKVKELQYRIDDGDWQLAASYNEHQPTINISINLPVGNDIELRAIGDIDGIRSEIYRFTQPPSVASVMLNDGNNQRSELNEITVTFRGEVNVDLSAFSLIQRSNMSGATGTSVGLALSTSIVANNTVATLNFTSLTRGNGALIDGNYQLTIFGSQVTDTNTGNSMPENYVFGESAADNFFSFFGSSNGSRTINVLNLLGFRQTYLESEGSQDFNSIFDFGGDGVVNVLDLLSFRQRYRQTLEFV